MPRFTNIINNTPTDSLPTHFHVILTGDGTQIGRGITVVNIAFTILEEGNRACSSSGNHGLAILKVRESDYTELYDAMQDIVIEASNLKTVTINDNLYKIEYFLGGDMKFLSIVCGIESATATYPCIWCKCPKGKRHDMELNWSITDTKQGARTVEEISCMSKLSKSSKKRFNCSHNPLFPFIQIDHVVIDTLHLFLRISDVLIDLLIRDFRLDDERNTDLYVKFLNEECKIHFAFYTEKESKALKWRDLTGPKKKRLFEHIDVPKLFPSLKNNEAIQKLWKDFAVLTEHLALSEEQLSTDQRWSPAKFDEKAKKGVKDFADIYQIKDVTPYMHCLAMHVSQFLELYGNIAKFNQQGLEKLNDLTTIYFQHASNHREQEALQQILEKRNRIEELEDQGHHRSVRELKCSKCNQTGHNKRCVL